MRGRDDLRERKHLRAKLSELKEELKDLELKESQIVSSRFPGRQDKETAWEDLMERQDEVEQQIEEIENELNKK